MLHFQKPPFKLCAQCGVALIAPIWVEHLDERHVKNLWCCEACGYEFESTVFLPILDTSPASATNALVH
jgi:hypothetical protein